MPISGAASYVLCCQAFLAHWAEVNEALAALTVPDELKLAGALLKKSTPVVRGDLGELYAALLDQRTVVTEALVELDFARSDLADLKARLVLRTGQLIALVRANAAGTKYERSLPLQPEVGDGLTPMRDAGVRLKKIWTGLNAGGVVGLEVPVVLQGGYALATFTSDVDALNGAYLAVTDTGATVKLEQEERNDQQDVIYAILKAYRGAMPGKFEAGDALIAALPLLTPLPGSTPEPVVLTGALDVPTNKARLSWTASTNPDLDHYEVRAVPGATYNSDDEVHVATIAKDATRELLTDHFLTDPGQTASFKVYVVLTTDNEAGSNAEAVTRPV